MPTTERYWRTPAHEAEIHLRSIVAIDADDNRLQHVDTMPHVGDVVLLRGTTALAEIVEAVQTVELDGTLTMQQRAKVYPKRAADKDGPAAYLAILVWIKVGCPTTGLGERFAGNLN